LLLALLPFGFYLALPHARKIVAQK
jgi:hypothetical protein